MPINLSLAGKTAIVTGAGSGIGRAIACELAIAGATVALIGRRAERLRETHAMIGSAGQTNVHAVDIADSAALANAVKAIAESGSNKQGSIDIVVNAAGVSSITDLAAERDRAEFDRIIATNLNAAFDLVRLALPHMADGTRIVNIASVLGLRPAPQSSAYCASKHGMIGLTRALAFDLAPRRIAVNAICPGWVDTDMSRDIIASISAQKNQPERDMRRTIEAGIPMRRMVEPGEVAQLVLYLCSPSAAAITGQAIAICAGSSIS